MIEKIKNKFDITFFKFILVGIVNTVVGTASILLSRIRISHRLFFSSLW